MFPRYQVLDVLHEYSEREPSITESIVARLWDSALSFLFSAQSGGEHGDSVLLRFSNGVLRDTVQELYGRDVERATHLQAILTRHLSVMDVESAAGGGGMGGGMGGGGADAAVVAATAAGSAERLAKWLEREVRYQRLVKKGLPEAAPPLALVKHIAELGDLERAVGDGGESYLEAFARLGHPPALLAGMRETAVPFLRQLGALGRGRVIRSVEELACRFNVGQLELLMTCTNTLVITGELMHQLRSLSLYDGGLLGILLERCPTTAIGAIPIMQIRQNMSETLDLAGAGLGACEVGLLAHYLAINRSLTQVS